MEQVTFRGLRRNGGRALLRRCPNCGARGVWRNWFATRERCPRCGLRFDRGEAGYFLGAYLINLVVAELAFAALLVATLVALWPNPPWTALTVASVVVAVAFPALLYPYTKGMWLAVDLLFRPERPGEIV